MGNSAVIQNWQQGGLAVHVYHFMCASLLINIPAERHHWVRRVALDQWAAYCIHWYYIIYAV